MMRRAKEQDARAFRVEERMRLIVGHVAHADQAAIGQFHQERGALRALGRHVDLQFDLMDVLRDAARADVEFDLDIRRSVHW
jgi:hypothetical protein